jgi:hypothetical protein
MAINFNTSNMTFRQLLGNGLNYRVPPFQRDYTWSDEEWDDLWQDILGLFDENAEPAHYMGYLVLQSSDNKRFDIIDGQQRLTTISVMILTMLSYLDNLANEHIDEDDNRKRKEYLQNSYIGYVDPVTLVPQPKLELNIHSDRYYKTHLIPLIAGQASNSSEKQLKRAFEWFSDKIKKKYAIDEQSGIKLTKFLDSLVDKLFFTVITVTDELNAFKVFETLNARGVRLSASDLLKNYLFSVIGAHDDKKDELKELEELWENIVEKLDDKRFEEFLRVYWNSYNKIVRQAELFKAIKKNINDRGEVFKLLRGLNRAADIYVALLDSSCAIWNEDEKSSIEHLTMFYVKQPFSMLIACYLKFFESNRKVFSKVLKTVSTISFRYNVICNLQTHTQETLYSEIALKISRNEYENPLTIIKDLRKIYPDDQQFKNAFESKELKTIYNGRNTKIVRYILREIEKRKYGQSFDIESSTYSIEHILPKSPSEEWAYIDETTRETYTYRIGNMTILERNPNNKLQNVGYTQKHAEYQKSKLGITKAIAEHYDSWDQTKIESRQVQLAKIAVKIWKLD